MYTINNQVSGKYANQSFSGKIVDVCELPGKTYVRIQLDEAITIRTMGTLQFISMEVDTDGNTVGTITGNIIVVARGQVATEARERCVIKRAQRAGVSTEYVTIMLGTFDMKKWSHRTVAEIIIGQWNKVARLAG